MLVTVMLTQNPPKTTETRENPGKPRDTHPKPTWQETPPLINKSQVITISFPLLVLPYFRTHFSHVNIFKGSVRNYWGEGSDICPHEKPKKIDPPLTLGKKIVTLPKIIQKIYDPNSHFFKTQGNFYGSVNSFNPKLMTALHPRKVSHWGIVF